MEYTEIPNDQGYAKETIVVSTQDTFNGRYDNDGNVCFLYVVEGRELSFLWDGLGMIQVCGGVGIDHPIIALIPLPALLKIASHEAIGPFGLLALFRTACNDWIADSEGAL